MSNQCSNCVQLAPIREDASACKKRAPKIEEFRLYCDSEVVPTLGDSTNCTEDIITDLVAADPIGNPTPIIAIDVTNEDDLDELNEFSFDRAEDVGEDTYTITPRIRVYNADHQCTLESLKGQTVTLLYKIENREGDFVWRRFIGEVTGVTGGLIGGYEVTFEAFNPSDEEIPLWVNFGTADATTAGIDALTNFG